ncbi:uncharacterized protein LOC113789663 [Dermatophagoides pteronyssinus]|uniref:uncharacterized protein LOC113789663 n=1 Tax=Dermatophagoides pteronyssinus TaxID=6956 RepID=UPI003F675388
MMLQLLTVSNLLVFVTCINIKLNVTNINRAMDAAIYYATEMKIDFEKLGIIVNMKDFHHEKCIFSCTAYTTTGYLKGKHCDRIEFPLAIELDQHNSLYDADISLGDVNEIGCNKNELKLPYLQRLLVNQSIMFDKN